MSTPKFKVVLLGDSTVGKSCLLLRFVNNTVALSHFSTIGVDVRNKTINTEFGEATLQIWDTAGQERFRGLSPSYLRNAEAVLLLYDITSSESFEHVSGWMETINKYTPSNLATILVGNKSDCEKERVISYEEGQALAEKFNILFKETSAMKGTGVNEVFTSLTCEIFKKGGAVPSSQGVKLEDAKTEERSGGCSCGGGNKTENEQEKKNNE